MQLKWMERAASGPGIVFAIEGQDKEMFRINRAFENQMTEIIRIEGKITDESLSDWNQAIAMIQSQDGREIILDFSQVWFISPKAVEALLSVLSDRTYILNCGMEVRNLLHASGLSGRMLE